MNVLPTKKSDEKYPNILLVVMDATRAKNFSLYGHNRPTTPNIERFAERCVVYDKAISAGCWSLPGHASIFTGLHPATHKANDQTQYLVPEHPTMAEVLRTFGYQTIALCHKRDVGPITGLDRGFDKFNPLSSTNTLKRLNRRKDNAIARMMGTRDKGAVYTNQKIYKLLPQLQAEGRPFFMFVSYLESHIPYRPPKKFNRYLPDGISPSQVSQVNQDRWKYMVGEAEMSEQDFDILAALYDGAITYGDSRINEMLTWLDQQGMLDDMMIIITADHGENLGEHQLMAHGYCLYDTVIHVPLIIHYPDSLVTPGRVEHQVQTVDLLPTILTMLGDTSSELFRSMQGYDLLSSNRREFTIAEQAHPDLSQFNERFPEADVSKYDRALKMIRTDNYKYIWASDGNQELYDLQADPDELSNIIKDHQNIADDLKSRLKDWQESVGA